MYTTAVLSNPCRFQNYLTALHRSQICFFFVSDFSSEIFLLVHTTHWLGISLIGTLWAVISRPIPQLTSIPALRTEHFYPRNVGQIMDGSEYWSNRVKSKCDRFLGFGVNSTSFLMSVSCYTWESEELLGEMKKTFACSLLPPFWDLLDAFSCIFCTFLWYYTKHHLFWYYGVTSHESPLDKGGEILACIKKRALKHKNINVAEVLGNAENKMNVRCVTFLFLWFGTLWFDSCWVGF